METNKNRMKGFTLLELLIVIAILAILSVTLVLVLNPAESLRKSRDTQRMSDLATMKTALGLYLTNTASPVLGGANNDACKSGAAWAAGDKIFYSAGSDAVALTNGTTMDGVAAAILTPSQVPAANTGLTNGNGWLPVNLNNLSGGAPISNYPVDPVNTVAVANAPASADLVYRYACGADNLTFEIDARLESTEFTSGTTNKMDKDGGNNAGLYEVGTKLDILGAGADF